MEKLKYAQDLIKTHNPSVTGGFNMFVLGDWRPVPNDGHYDHGPRCQGYDKAEEMARSGKIYYTRRFKCHCGGNPFQYGGFFICDKCNHKKINKDWWVIQVEQDGNAFCCHGLGFVNILESNNYAFGGTRQEAIDNYEKVMREATPLSA